VTLTIAHQEDIHHSLQSKPIPQFKFVQNSSIIMYLVSQHMYSLIIMAIQIKNGTLEQDLVSTSEYPPVRQDQFI
jgi:hypothetical protein